MNREELLKQKPGSVIKLKDGTRLYIEENDLDYEFGRMCYGCKTHKRCYFFKDKKNLECPGQLGICEYCYTELDQSDIHPDYYAVSGKDVIVEERDRQIKEEGWSKDHDLKHNKQELLKAAVCYLLANIEDYGPYHAPKYWPWDMKWWKPEHNSESIKNLKKAGALIAAEIDRLNRVKSIDADFVED